MLRKLIDRHVYKEENATKVICTSSRIRSVESALTVECWWPFSFLKRNPALIPWNSGYQEFPVGGALTFQPL